jgi:putative endonuclease
VYYFYLLRCKDGSLYAGSTSDLQKRERTHNSGRGSAYVRSRGGGVIVYAEEWATQSEALQREAAVKRLPKRKKEQLVDSA